jgi:hypothetical protein
VARHYSLIGGWGTSYPETTGYIVPTLIAYAQARRDDALLRRARRMLDWLVAIQLPDGAFQAGTIDAQPIVPVTFNTGQIVLGLAAGAGTFGDPYLTSMRAASEWLVATQDVDGCWRTYPSPFAASGGKAYQTHVAWGLLEAARIAHEGRYADAAIRNVSWALSQARANGWFDNCCLDDPARPLTHTIGYVLRGLIEVYRHTRDSSLLAASRRTGEGLLSAIEPDGFLPGRLDRQWKGAVAWVCLTGSVQVAHCLLLLYQETGEPTFRDAAFALNRYVRRTVRVDGPAATRGAVKGSFPISGDYGRFQYLSWAAKFFIDSNLLEQSIRRTQP